MHKYFYCLLGLLLAMFTFQSCQNSDSKLKEQIVGSYYSVYTEDDEDFYISIESVDKFSSNGKVYEKSKITFTEASDDGSNVSFQYDISLEGVYEIKNSYLIYDYDLNNINIQPSATQETTSDEKLAPEHLDFYIKNHFLLALKEELINNTKSKIVYLDSKTLVIEDTDEQHTLKRIEKEVDSGLPFNDFIQKFANNLDYQISHIKFPISGAKTKEEWMFLDEGLIFKGEKIEQGQTLHGSFKIYSDKASYSLGYSESSLIFRLDFVKDGDTWMLVNYFDPSDELEQD